MVGPETLQEGAHSSIFLLDQGISLGWEAWILENSQLCTNTLLAAGVLGKLCGR